MSLKLYKLFPLLVWVTILEVGATGRLVLTGGTVIDGSGSPGFVADVAVEAGRIVAVGNIDPLPNDSVFSAVGKVVAPGFIDLHNHSVGGLLETPEAPTQVSQGITTVVLGPDGGSPFPPAEYRVRLREKGVAVNVALMVGHGTVRRMVLGNDFRRAATDEEVKAMQALVRLAMQQGTFGLSSGLEYDPGFYSETSELVALAREAGAWGGFYMSHVRDEESEFREALQEAVRIGREASLPILVSHIKLGDTTVWGRAREALQVLHDAAAEGLDVLADCYPYNAWASSLSILVPSRDFENREEIAHAFVRVGGADKVLITRYPADPSFEFKTLADLALEKQTTAVDIFIEMMRQGGASVVCESMNPEDVATFLKDPLVAVASDGGTDSRHPRGAGTFPRVLGRYVREQGLLTPEEAIRKMTGLPAGRLGLKDRGLVRSGYVADLVVFDPERVVDRSDFQNPSRLAEGIELVLVNGTPVWNDGKVTGELPGEPLLRPRGPEGR